MEYAKLEAQERALKLRMENQRKDNVIRQNFHIKTNFQTKNFLHHLFPFLRIESNLATKWRCEIIAHDYYRQ